MGVGRIAVEMKAERRWNRAVLQDVIYVPELHGNLLSVSQLARRGADVNFTKGGYQIHDQHGLLTCVGMGTSASFRSVSSRSNMHTSQ